MSADVEIAALDPRPNGDRVLIRFREFNGKNYVDVRLFFVSERGDLRPTQKGISLQLGELWNFADAKMVRDPIRISRNAHKKRSVNCGAPA